MTEISQNDDQTRSDVLSRPVASFLSLDWEKAIYLLFILIAVVTRFWNLGDRVVSHDESLHTQYSYQYYNGDGYSHTPLMHGPSLFHITAFSYWLFGDSDTSARIPVAIVGIILIVLPYFFRDWIGRLGALTASFILLISPYITYYSRYIRHDIYIITAAVITFIAIQFYIRKKKDSYLWWLALGLALMFTTMETSFLYLAIFGSFIVLKLSARILKSDWISSYATGLRLPVLLLVLGIILIFVGRFGHRFAPSALDEGSPEITVSAEQGFAADPAEELPPTPDVAGDSDLDRVLRWTEVAGYFVLAAGLFLVAYKLREHIEKFPEFDLVVLLTTLTLPTMTAYLVVRAGGDPLNNALNKCQLVGQEGMGAIELFINRLGQAECRDAFIESDIVLTTIFLIATLVASILVGLWWNRRRWLIAAAIFHGIFLLLYSSLFTNPAGWTSGMVGSLGYWLAQQEVERANQPTFFYFFVLPLYEFLPLILSLLAIHLWSQKNRITHFIARLAAVIVAAILARSLVNWIANRNVIEEGMQTDLPGQITFVAIILAFLIYTLLEGRINQDLETAPRPGWRELLDIDYLFGFVPYVIWWFLASWLIFSLAGEKMAWLSTHFIVPMALLAGWYLNERFVTANLSAIRSSRFALMVGLILVLLIAVGIVLVPIFLGKIELGSQSTENLSRFGQLLGSVLVLVVLVYFVIRIGRDLEPGSRKRAWLIGILSFLAFLTIRFSYLASFVNYDYTNEFLVYAHGAPATKEEVIPQLETLSKRMSGGKDIKVAFDNDSSWPYTWYLRDYPNRIYFGENPGRNITEAPVVIVGSQNWGKVEPILGDDYDSRTYTFLWWPMEEYRNVSWNAILGDPQIDAEFRRGLADPEVRQALWDIFMYRDYEKYGQVFGGTYTAGQWPLRHDLRLYLRKDSLATLWDHGFDAIAAEPPVDLYAENNLILEPLAVFGSPGVDDGQFMQPRNLAVGPNGNLFVVDSGNHRVQVLSPDGTFIRGWGSFGTVPGSFNEPWAIAVDEDYVYVADTWNHRIQKFTHEGEFVDQFGASGSPAAGEEGGGLFFGPRDVVQLNDGNLLVTDTGNHRVQIFDSDGNFLFAVGSQGNLPGQFFEPVGLGYGPDGSIYVADTWNGRIQKFSDSFLPVTEWEVDAWYGESINNKPYMTVDDLGRIYVSDPEGYRLIVFDENGSYLGRFGQYSLGTDGFGLPIGAAVDQDGYVYVADAGNSRIMKFAPFPSSLPQFPDEADELGGDGNELLIPENELDG